MAREFDDEICKVLLNKFEKELKAGLEGYYVWDFDEQTLNDVVSLEFVKKLEKEKKYKDKEINKENIPQKTKILKEELKGQFGSIEQLKGNNQIFLAFANWIITKWGGINNPPSNEKILQNKQNVFDGKLSFDSISSLSKIASFLNDKQCAVYDSRVAFTLNWLIFINHWHKNDPKRMDYGNMKFFQQPGGKNSDMKDHLQSPRFMKYFKIDNGKRWFTKNYCYTREETYQKYLSLLRETCNYWNYKHPNSKISIGKLEMCLFSKAAKDKKNPIKSIYETDESQKFITNEMDDYVNNKS